ncbi:hypothetical protein K466DRAFT_595194 [Polyporus arcularius HHB13444]|uniref:Uncharacterized protein n=1 Tax=Polyporus arcularius HHB13444 TaxID=1314778 RepID=A0A5C3PSF4_9APHY|nr:hypothetical protein K466DRAFT_595194 [Polyporus arcularius HHB13444]
MSTTSDVDSRRDGLIRHSGFADPSAMSSYALLNPPLPRPKSSLRTLVITPCLPPPHSLLGCEQPPSASQVLSNMPGSSTGDSEDGVEQAPPSPLTELSDSEPEEDAEEASTGRAGTGRAGTRRSVQPTSLFLIRKTHSHPDSEDPSQIIETAWFQTKGASPIPQPPHFVEEKRYLGDLFYHRHPVDPDRSQLWIWLASPGLPPRWKPVDVGYRREDGRYLSKTPKRKDPSWIRRDYFERREAEDSL